MGGFLFKVTKGGRIIGGTEWRDRLWKFEQERVRGVVERQEQKQQEEYIEAVRIAQAYEAKRKKLKRTPTFKRKTIYYEYGDRIEEMWNIGYTQRQIAASLGISSQTVWSVLNRRKKEGKDK